MQLNNNIPFRATPNKKSFDQLQDEQLIKLYKQFQEKPFEYAKIDYFKGKEPKITTYPKESFLTKAINKIKNILKK